MIESYADILRLVVLSLYGVLVGLTIRILVLYKVAEHATPKRGQHRGLLTRHVITIVASYLILATESVYENMIRFGDPFTAYIPANGCGFLFGIYALSEMLRFERRRVDLLTGKAVLDVRATEDTEVER